MTALECVNVGKTLGDPPVHVLSQIHLKIEKGEFVSLVGRSGSGKSTLLYLLSTLDTPSSGEVLMNGRSLRAYSDGEIYQLRNQRMGFVFQFHYLISELSALENCLLPARKLNQQDVHEPYARELLTRFGLDGKFDRLPRQLSGGEQQRVAIARAMVLKPEFLFADEPTGALDSRNGQMVMEIIKEANSQGTTVVLVTHDVSFAQVAKRQIYLADGKIVNQL